MAGKLKLRGRSETFGIIAGETCVTVPHKTPLSHMIVAYPHMPTRFKVMRPFIYISALRRTGSTVLSESLTRFPQSFIFREPRLGCGRFSVKAADAELFLKHGIDLPAFSDKWTVNKVFPTLLRHNRLVHGFSTELMPKLSSICQQIGIKEIYHDGWRFIVQAFPDVRFVLTARDPRDIFVSTFYRVRDGKDRFRRGFSARELARTLNRDFKQQRMMSENCPSVKVRYEDLCDNREETLKLVKEFVDSPVEGFGEVGQFNATNPNREREAALHGGTITTTRVQRWKQETNQDLIREAQKMFDLMPEFVEFWGYER